MRLISSFNPIKPKTLTRVVGQRKQNKPPTRPLNPHTINPKTLKAQPQTLLARRVRRRRRWRSLLPPCGNTWHLVAIIFLQPGIGDVACFAAMDEGSSFPVQKKPWSKARFVCTPSLTLLRCGQMPTCTGTCSRIRGTRIWQQRLLV